MNAFESKRKHTRKEYNADVVFSINYNSYCGEIKDISLSGAFISLNNVPTVNDDDEVRVTIPYVFRQKDVTLRGRIARYAENGVGIEFF